MQTIRRFLLNVSYACRIRKPRLIWRLIKTFLGILFLRRRPLRYVDFAIGFACNLTCEHCFATALEAPKHLNRKMMTPEDVRQVVGQAMALGAVNFSFQGGEPTAYKTLPDYIAAARPDRNLISVTTNGTLLDREGIKRLKGLGVDVLTISLDSAVAEEHDRFRGKAGSFEKTLTTVKEALSCGLKVTLGAVVSHHNIATTGFVDLIELAHRLGVILFLAEASPVGEWADQQDVILTADDRQLLDRYLKKYPLLRTDFTANYLQTGCGAIKEILYITPYGDVFACPFLHFSWGNIFDTTLKSIREKGLKHPEFATFQQRCLAADPDFLQQYGGPFYDQLGEVKKIDPIPTNETIRKSG